MEKRFPSPHKTKNAREMRQMGLYNLKKSKEKIMSPDELELKRKEEAQSINIQI